MVFFPTEKCFTGTVLLRLSARLFTNRATKSFLLFILSLPTFVMADPFAEDFSNETNLWTVGYWDDDEIGDLSAGSEIIRLDNSIQLRAAGDSNSAHRAMTFESPYNTDSGIDTLFSAIVQPDVSSTISETGELRIRLLHYFHNSRVDGGFPDREGVTQEEGNVRSDLRIKIRPEGSQVQLCFDERDADGRLQEYLILDGNSNDCASFPLTIPELGGIYELALSINRETSVLTASVNGESMVVQFPTDTNLRSFEQPSIIDVSTEGEGDVSVVNIFAVETDSFVDDFRVNGSPLAPLLSNNEDQRIIRGIGDRRPSIVDGTVNMTVSSVDGEVVQSRLNLEGEADYLEALMSLRSETVFEVVNDAEPATAMVRLSGSQYDVFADGGLDETGVGLAWARIEIFMNPDRSTGARYCLQRFDTGAPDFDSTPLLASGELCNNFQTVPLLDEFYLTSIETNRDERIVVFTIGDESVVHQIAEPEVFQEGPDRQFNSIRSRMENGVGTVVAFGDNLRNDPDALTREEQRSQSSATVTGGSGGSGASGLVLLMLLLLRIITSSHFSMIRKY